MRMRDEDEMKGKEGPCGQKRRERAREGEGEVKWRWKMCSIWAGVFGLWCQILRREMETQQR